MVGFALILPGLAFFAYRRVLFSLCYSCFCNIFLDKLAFELVICLRIERHLAAKTGTNSAVFVLEVVFVLDG